MAAHPGYLARGPSSLSMERSAVAGEAGGWPLCGAVVNGANRPGADLHYWRRLSCRARRLV